MHNPAGFVLITDEDYINDFLNYFKSPDDVTSSRIQSMFSSQSVVDKNTKKITKVLPPEYYTSDEFILKKGILPNVLEDTQTNFGLYLFNMFCVSSIFGDRIPYFNPPTGLTPDDISDLQQKIIDLLLAKRAVGKEFALFQTRCNFLGFKGTLWIPGQSFNFVKVNPKVKEAKPRLLAAWKAEVEAGADPATSYVIMVEQPLLKIAKEDLKNDPSWPIYGRGGKPKFGNVYKNCTISMGPVFDPVNGKYTIATNSYMEGIDNNMTNTFANIQIDAAYNRAVNTQDGGAKTKQIFAAMQSVKLNPLRGSNCGTKRYLTKTITSKNLKLNLLRFILDEKTGKLVKLTEENAHQFLGKTVKMRSPIFCQGDDYCNMCAGDYYYEIGIINIGNVCVKPSSRLLNLSLKSMHDISLNTIAIDPKKYFQKI